MNLLTFSFGGTNSELIANTLRDSGEVRIIGSSVYAIDELIDHIRSHRYSHLLGIGQYSGRDHDKIRIETECTSKFRNLDTDRRRVPIPYFLHEDEYLKLARGIGNSWCNLASYRITQQFPGISYTFLHVPTRYEIARAQRAIRRQLATMS